MSCLLLWTAELSVARCKPACWVLLFLTFFLLEDEVSRMHSDAVLLTRHGLVDHACLSIGQRTYAPTRSAGCAGAVWRACPASSVVTRRWDDAGAARCSSRLRFLRDRASLHLTWASKPQAVTLRWVFMRLAVGTVQVITLAGQVLGMDALESVG